MLRRPYFTRPGLPRHHASSIVHDNLGFFHEHLMTQPFPKKQLCVLCPLHIGAECDSSGDQKETGVKGKEIFRLVRFPTGTAERVTKGNFVPTAQTSASDTL